MSFTDFKEITTNNVGTSLRYGGDDVKQIMQILNGKTVSQKRPRILNEWIWLDHFDITPPVIAPVSPTDTNASRIYADPTSFKLKIKKTGGSIIDIENIDIPDSALSQITNKAKLHSQVAYKDETVWLTNAMVSTTAAIAWSKISKVGSILDDIADVLITNPQVDQVLRWDGGQWINATFAGEANTASNIGTAGIGIFKQKVGSNLELKKVNAGSTKITITDDLANNEVDVDLVEANLNLDSIGGSIATRSKLPATVVYDDESNTWGAFDQIFKSGRLKIRNPADTFSYILATSAIVTADRTVTLPLLTGDDTFVVQAFAQPLTNKTIDASLNTLSNIGDAAIAAHTSTKITITAKGQLNSSLVYKDQNNDLGDFYLDFGDIVAPANPAAGIRRLYVDSTTGVLSVRTSAGTSISLEAAGITTLDGLSDVEVPVPLLNQVLTFDGLKWVSATPPGASGGEANTGSNIGTAGVGIHKQKVGVDLQFKKLNAGSTKVTITDDTANNEVDIDVTQANLDLESIGGSITTRSKLPSAVVYDDEANTFGDFAQKFRWNQLIVQNAGNNAGAFFRYSGGTNRGTIIPSLGADDTFVFQAFAQSLTNKTIDVSLNTVSNIADAHIAAHTSTKITVTAKGQLNTALVYNDQANIFGAFDQTFKSSRVKIRNPADTFGYTLVAGAIAADRLVNIPLLTADDTLVTEGFAQPLTNKTINAASNTVTNIGDSAIAAHTSTKITINSKAQLLGAVAYEDESNAFVTSQAFNSYVDLAVIAAPANPDAGFVRCYPKVLDANSDTLVAKQKINGVIREVHAF